MNANDIRALAARLVTAERVIIGVRHHSPACARAVHLAIEKYRPAAVLVEGPRSFNPLIDALTDSRTRAPLAVYAYTESAGRGAARFRGLGAYYPFCDFSPELVALREARAAGIPASFIDLDIAEQHAVVKRDDVSDMQWDERRLLFSETLVGMAQRLGCRDTEELWDHLFETDVVDAAEHSARMTAYCALARADSNPGEHKRDGTDAREAEMAWHIREAVAEANGRGPVLVVVGGYHAVALPDLLEDPPPRPVIKAPSSRAALIRFTFEQVDSVNGYASGIRSPGWRQRAWEEGRRKRTDHRSRAAREVLLDVAQRLRARGVPASMPTVVDAAEHVERLAALRGRPGPTRWDVRDAVASTFVKGDIAVEGMVPLAVAEAVLTGDKVGRVPPGTATPPLVADALARLTAARLVVDDPAPRELSLAVYRRPAHRQTSRLLHGLALLEVPFASLVAGPDFVVGTGLHLINERWTYRWSPGTEAGLVEASRYGSTLPEAVAACFSEAVDDFTGHAGRGAAMAVSLIARSCVIGVRDLDEELAAAATTAIADEPSFCAAAAACHQLAMLHRAREPLDARDFPGLDDLARIAFRRADYLARLLPSESPTEMVTALLAMRDALSAESGGESGVLDQQTDRDDFGAVVRLFAQTHESAEVRGAAAGIRYTAGESTAEEVADALRGSLSGTVPVVEALPFLSGLMRTAREFAWQEPHLVEVVGALLDGWTETQFLEALPALRLALAELTPAETDRVAAVVAGRSGPVGGNEGPVGGKEGPVGGNRKVADRAAELLAAQGLSGWLGVP
ncbi:DUF5682 family protein [Gordonia crocea]|uniref:Uncharacterized protein n=1 Tax=Gordonia crocea TaxID=589162 RepID=A0A7M4BQ36_9ACTN|nr:DUF5682 family protein [Gordonia crocea]GED95997.1 hypothetical protein nbrc107697_00360 [Gordonia crocea]